MRVLVVGRTGQISTELRARLPAAGHEVLALEAPELDLTNADSIAAAIAGFMPDAVINAAAYTAVDRAEDDAEIAFAVNSTGPGLLGEATARAGIPVVHYSTDYVFDGTKPTPYTEDDTPNPVGVYGTSKLDGERRLHAANPRSVTLRTAWVCSAHGSNFVKTMLRLGRERPEVRVVADQHGAPTFADDLADGSIALLSRITEAHRQVTLASECSTLLASPSPPGMASRRRFLRGPRHAANRIRSWSLSPPPITPPGLAGHPTRGCTAAVPLPCLASLPPTGGKGWTGASMRCSLNRRTIRIAHSKPTASSSPANVWTSVVPDVRVGAL